MNQSVVQSPILTVEKLLVILEHATLLENISFSVKSGDVVAVVGPNGAGKTILFRALLGLIPFRGSVIWAPGVRLGYVPQKLAIDRLVPITGREFFLLKSPHFWLTPKNFLDHLQHELSLVGLSEKTLSKPINELSGGQFQRLLIAWAMIDHPDVLLFDEPTTGIDIASVQAVYQILDRLAEERQTTVLLITHDLGVVKRYADQVIGLDRHIITSGTPKMVLGQKAIEQLFGFIPNHNQAIHNHPTGGTRV